MSDKVYLGTTVSKEALSGLDAMAAREHRNRSNMLDVLLRDACQRGGVFFDQGCATPRADVKPSVAARGPKGRAA